MDRNWCLKLDKSKSMLIAVDSRTGKEIAPLIGFSKAGIRSYVGVEKELIDSGYDPYEHGYTYDKFGGICVKFTECLEEIKEENEKLIAHNNSLLNSVLELEEMVFRYQNRYQSESDQKEKQDSIDRNLTTKIYDYFSTIISRLDDNVSESHILSIILWHLHYNKYESNWSVDDLILKIEKECEKKLFKEKS